MKQDRASNIDDVREKIKSYYLAKENKVIKELVNSTSTSLSEREKISHRAIELVRNVRSHSKPTMMENFLAQYGLTTKEGVALMCLAEALLRVPDKVTIDDLMEDKIASGSWGEHLGQSGSPLINSSTWALLMTGKLIAPLDDKNWVHTLRKVIKKLGEPVVRVVVVQVMKELGHQFVLGQTIAEAIKRAKNYEAKGYSYSYDMLGEAARTDADALTYLKAYSNAITELKSACVHSDIRMNPGISVKLSALHPRYEFGQRERVMNELVPRAFALASEAKAAGMGFNIDAEEADRLDLSLDIIEAVLSNPELEGWDGFGVVVQAFGKRASYVIDWLYALSVKLDRRIMVRLVKGAYWDAEIKRAQEMGLSDFPVFTRKVNSDISYIACAKKLLSMTDRIYPQFATHNAHSVSAILELAKEQDYFEFQRLHGMGESLHEEVVSKGLARCRIYAPVGSHQDLLAYLVRRLLENGANSSFVNQIVDTSIEPEDIARDPFVALDNLGNNISNQAIALPADLYGKGRRNSKGWDITDPLDIRTINNSRNGFRVSAWEGGPMLDGSVEGAELYPVHNPVIPNDVVGKVIRSSINDVETAITSAEKAFDDWSSLAAEKRSNIIKKVGDLFEDHTHELFALATREAGKTLQDGIAEVREAVDFARYYANEGIRNESAGYARGIIVCISPWNFPLAIFAGQVLASLATGNVVIAKPAEQTVLIAARAIELMHEAGIPKGAIQLVPGRGSLIGNALTSDPRVAGVCFTGSTKTAQQINSVMSGSVDPGAPLVAETGGLNAMIVDSTALPEQVVRDVLASAFQSAGQRCSALRMLYVQKDIADGLLEMLFGAMDELKVGSPWDLSTDVGPVIDHDSKMRIDAHCAKFKKMGRVLKSINTPSEGFYVSPTVIRLEGIEELDEEVFGPILHVATFEGGGLDKVVDAINLKGFGLTFGLHSRVNSRVERISNRIKVGNIYVNRNQIGAIVGSQPFGGEGLSGTGPKAGGPQYVKRFMKTEVPQYLLPDKSKLVDENLVTKAIDQLNSLLLSDTKEWTKKLPSIFGKLDLPFIISSQNMPGPTGEINEYSAHARGLILCLGPDTTSALTQANIALMQGNRVVVVSPNVADITKKAKDQGIPIIGINGYLMPDSLSSIYGFEAVASVADYETLREYRIALSRRDGALLPLITELKTPERFTIERHVCVDTTAAGGNASLIAESE